MEINDCIRGEYFKMLAHGDNSVLINYLKSLLKVSDDLFLTGFCYWNISDLYAVMRMPDEVYRNHLDFYEFLNSQPKKYKLWCVCDCSQKFTLQFGGYGDFWWELYSGISGFDDIADIEHILFECHRTAFSYTSKCPVKRETVLAAYDIFSRFLTLCAGSDDLQFYRIIFAALCLKNKIDSGIDIYSLSESFLPLLRSPKQPLKYAYGEWQALNAERSDVNKARVGLNAAVNAFIHIGETNKASKLYKTAVEYGLPTNDYIDSRL